MRTCRLLLLTIASLLLPSFAFAEESATPSRAGKLVKVVILSRHGVRSPTDAPSVLDTWTTRKTRWPAWYCSAGNATICGLGQLTPRGKMLADQMGRYYGRRLSALVSDPCPAPEDVFFYANLTERTQETALALLRGFRPAHCETSQYFHKASTAPDTLFNPDQGPGCTLDFATAKQGISDEFDGLTLTQYVTDHLGQERTIAQDSLRCCEPALCQNPMLNCGGAGQTCDLSVLPTCIITSPPYLNGGLRIAATFAEIALFEYASGFEPEDVGWGIDKADMIKAFRLNTATLGLMRTQYLAQLLGSRLLTKILFALEGYNDGQPSTAPANAKFVAYVGHDTNIANVAGILGLHWQQAGYQEDQIPPAGALIFERRTAGAGEDDRVYVFYAAQSLDDMRALEGDHPVSTFVPVPGCDADGSCALEEFATLVRQNRIDNRKCWN